MATLLPAGEVGRPYTFHEAVYIAGAWRDGRGTRREQDRDPYTGEVLVELQLAGHADLDEAYRAAATAGPRWAAAPPHDRSEVLRRAATIMVARRDEIVRWLVREAGSTRIKATLEWDAVHAVIEDAAMMPYQVEGGMKRVDIPGKESRIYRKPVGVVAVISPWNWPLQLTARSVFPALAVGNAVVVKPASDTPITGGLLVGKILEEAGLPPGVINVLVGSGSEIGDDVVRHPVPRVISFTGSTPVGRGIARLAAEATIIKRVELELGGNAPFVVLDDADLERAAEAAVFGKFLHQGQICMIANRFIVDEAVYDEFLDRFVARVKALKVGNPDEPDTMIGPIINEKQLRGLQHRISQARAAGFRELAGGAASGLVLPPHIFADVTNNHPVAKEELFGPIAPVIRAYGERDALRLANETEYGLSSCVFTRDLERGVEFAQCLEAGMAHVNDQPVNDIPGNPFGGEKNSGIGRFNGAWAIQAFTTDQWVTVQHAPRAYPTSADQIAGAWGGG
ncbi:MAG TPA: aldehyde dehydrogenase family protein [Kofleriaceae bacterium]